MNPDNLSYGPMRAAAPLYFGETYLTPRALRESERWANGAIVGERNKFGRRVLRGHAKKRMSTFEVNLRAAQVKHAKIRGGCTNPHEYKREVAHQRLVEVSRALADALKGE